MMTLVLVRHGEAEGAGFGGDEHRALTEEGRRYVRTVGGLLAGAMEPVDALITSPLVRAVQTAEILAGALGLDEVVARPEVAFPARLEQLWQVVDEVPAHVRGLMMVGHEPTLGVFASWLAEAAATIPFRTGTALTLAVDRRTRAAQVLHVITGRPATLTRAGA
ncbi:MAG: histidine phosphatase family protein [Deltaproteobacteria bacterium]|nr:histidine phosphatase family protein [Deltaproteobacteria bacterium]